MTNIFLGKKTIKHKISEKDFALKDESTKENLEEQVNTQIGSLGPSGNVRVGILEGRAKTERRPVGGASV